ncbi:MAG: hypothetical protein JWQ74_3180 [Marmoricola sp.]|nr:hypothetical protein [Marmoricola sp.]
MNKKILSLVLGAMLGVLAVVGFAPAAQAYPEVVIDLTAQPTTLYGGEQFTATATANVTCSSWTLEWNGDSRSKTAAQFSTRFTAPDVSKVTYIPLHGTCDYALPAGATPVTRSAATDTSWTRTIVITVLPRGQASPPTIDDGGKLPNTGGPSLWLLVAGFALAAAGAAAVARSRSAKAL